MLHVFLPETTTFVMIGERGLVKIRSSIMNLNIKSTILCVGKLVQVFLGFDLMIYNDIDFTADFNRFEIVRCILNTTLLFFC